MKKTIWFSMASMTMAIACVVAHAQGTETPAEEAASADKAQITVDELNRGTPKRSAETLVKLLDESNFETASEYLDLHNLHGPANAMAGADLAQQFLVIIRRAKWVDIDVLIDDPEGRSNDNLPDYRDSIGVISHDGVDVRLLMQKVPRGDGAMIWKVSNATVSQIPELYAIYGYPEPIEDLRRALPNVKILGYEPFKWVTVLVAGAIVYTVVFLLALMIRRFKGEAASPSRKRIVRFLLLPFGLWAVIITINSIAHWFGDSITSKAWHQISPIPTLVTLWMVFCAVNLLRDLYANRISAGDRPGAAVLLRPAGNAIKLLVGVVAILFYLHKLGINITTVVAGLGVGGIAVALALQKPMEDVFAAFSLYIQQHMKVGDFCLIEGQIGKIEEIGLRTTRIRTRDKTVIAMPNARLASEAINNFSSRDRTRYRSYLRLRFDTTPAQIRQILDRVRALFASSAEIMEGKFHVRFREIAEDALVIDATAYVATIDWDKYLEVSEELNLGIVEIVADAGASFALPVRLVRDGQRSRAGQSKQ